MDNSEIELPKESSEFILKNAQETHLGFLNGAKKQYRSGNLHIREYDDKLVVHADKYDPRSDPLRHLVYDAPEVLVGICAALGGGAIASMASRYTSGRPFILATAISMAASGYAGYAIAKKIKRRYS